VAKRGKATIVGGTLDASLLSDGPEKRKWGRATIRDRVKGKIITKKEKREGTGGTGIDESGSKDLT